MRCSQIMGLSDGARKFLKKGEKLLWTDHIRRVFPDGSEEEEVYEHCAVEIRPGEGSYGMFHEFEFDEFVFPDGTVYEEYVQHEVWSSGPMIWLAIRHKDTKEPVKETLWPCDDLEY